MKKVIVTGANGFIGSKLIKEMLKHLVSVTAIDVAFSPSNLPKSENIKEYALDLKDTDKLREILKEEEYDTFYHLAWRGVNGEDKANPLVQTDNLNMTLSCAKIAHENGCKKFLCAGTIAEQATNSLGNLNKTSGGMMYGVAKHCTHLMLETFCKNVGLDFVWMQFSNIYGPKNKTGNLVSYTIEEILHNREASFGPTLQPYDFIYVDDLIDAVYKLGNMKTKSNHYFIGSGSPRILKEYLYQIGELCEKRELIKIGKRPDDGIRYTMEMFDTSKLVEDIGNYVSTSFEDGVRNVLNDFDNVK